MIKRTLSIEKELEATVSTLGRPVPIGHEMGHEYSKVFQIHEYSNGTLV